MDVLDGVYVVSDRALEGAVQNLRGRSVVLVDDSIVLGTTLVDLYDRIVGRTGDGGLVTTLVAAIDAERFSPALADHLGLSVDAEDAPVRRSTKELERFAYQVASCLYRAGLPYFTDFPILRELQLDLKSLARLLQTPNWFVAEVTAPRRFAGPERRAWTFIPRPDAFMALQARSDPELVGLAEVCKVRAYAHLDDTAAKVRFVPIGIPGAMQVPQLDRVLTSVADRVPAAGGVDTRGWAPVAKHRLLQMYLSAFVLAQFWVDLDPLVDRALDGSVIEDRPIASYFGRDDVAPVVAAFEGIFHSHDTPSSEVRAVAPYRPRSGLAVYPAVRRRMVESQLIVEATRELAEDGQVSLLADALPTAKPALGEVAKVNSAWVHQVLLVFGLIDNELERPQEEQLRHLDYATYRTYRENDGNTTIGVRVLKQGITLQELLSYVLPDADIEDPWEAALLSLAVDLGNDLGIVVPSTVCAGGRGPVHRLYRSGETAFLSAVDPSEFLSRDAASLLEGNDRLICDVLDDLVEKDVAAATQFDKEMRLIIGHALPGRVVQAWHGEVTDVNEATFRAIVVSRLQDGETDAATLPKRLIHSSEIGHLARDAAFDWVVFEKDDIVGKPESIARIRLAPPAISHR